MRALLLDALGTLVALDPPGPRLRAELSERVGIEVSEAEAQRAIDAEIGYYRAHLDEGRDQVALAALRGRCAEVVRDALPARDSIVALDGAALTGALLAALRFTAFPDARPAILAARRRGERVVVVSNWDVSLHDVLADTGLAALLDGIVTSAEAGARKPDRAIFERALQIAGCAAAEAVHVGDSVSEDVDGASRAGIEPVLVRRDDGAGPPGVRTIASLAELP
jgi:putative hydrolase of the HAD superfamily